MGQEKRLLLLFALGHLSLGRLITFFLAALLGPMDAFAAVVAHVFMARSALLPPIRTLLLPFVLAGVLAANVAASATVSTSCGAVTIARLHTSHPLLHEGQTALAVLRRGQLLPLLHGMEMSNGLDED
jgi:hypothetical protein